MAQAELSAELTQNITESTTGIAGFWNKIKRWPLISIVVLTLLILTALFANVIAPHSPLTAIPDYTILAPAWEDAKLVSVQDLPLVAAIDGEFVNLSVAEAAEQYNVTIDPEIRGDAKAIREAFKEQADVRANVMELATVTEVRQIDAGEDAPWTPVGLNILAAAEQYGVEMSLEQIADPLYGGIVAEESFEKQAGLEIKVQDAAIPRPVLTSVAEAAERYGVVIPPDQMRNEEAINDAFLQQANLRSKVRIPTTSYLLGGDNIGRDLLSRLIHGARVSLVVVSIALSSGLLIGVSMGLVAGWFGGLIDEVIMRVTDIWLGLPFILVAIVVVIAIGQTFIILIGLLALLSWTPFVRNVRGEVLSLKTRDYVSLAQVAGASTFRIMVWHLLPGVINTVIVIATLRVGQLILTEAILSFLGAGIPPPTPAWGAMVNDGRVYIEDAWWISFFPGFCIFLVVMSLNFLGDWMRDRFDPRLRQL